MNARELLYFCIIKTIFFLCERLKSKYRYAHKEILTLFVYFFSLFVKLVAARDVNITQKKHFPLLYWRKRIEKIKKKNRKNCSPFLLRIEVPLYFAARVLCLKFFYFSTFYTQAFSHLILYRRSVFFVVIAVKYGLNEFLTSVLLTILIRLG